MNIISANDVRFYYETEEEAGGRTLLVLDDIRLDIERGEFVALLGHNGSGKSTLAKHFNAMLLPSGGRVLVSGMDT